MLDVQDLKIFREVALLNSISKAALSLGFVQSAITARIQRLENFLSTKLFYRQHRGVTLTSAGKTLLEYTHKIFVLLEETCQAVQYSPSPTGVLKIGSMETTAAVRLPSILCQYHEQYPEVILNLQTNTTEDLIAAILNYELDGAFIAEPIAHKNLACMVAFEEQLVFISSKKYNSLEDFSLANRRVLLAFRDGCSYRAKMKEIVSHIGVVVDQIFEFGSLEAIIAGVTAGMGISLLPLSIVKKYSDDANLTFNFIPAREYSLRTIFIWRKDMLMTSAMERFIDFIKKDCP